MPTTYCILDFGACADATHDNAPAIQRAVAAAAAGGGGVVLVPPGTFGTKKVLLQSHVELHLEPGAILHSLLEPIAAPGANCPEPSCNPKEFLLGGVGLEDVAITGAGRIDGRGYDRFWPREDGLEHPLYGQRYWPQLHRPKGLIHFRESRGIAIHGITILDPPCYNIWLLGCDRIDIAGVHIDADLKGPNDDGIDLDCCSNARITGCDIRCGDDGIALKSDIHELGYDKPCENITISDCRIKATSDGIRLGYEGDGAIRHVAVSNCVIYDTMIGISLMVAISPSDIRGVDIQHGPAITDIRFDQLVIHSFQTFNFQYPKNPPDCAAPITGYLDRIAFHGITAVATRGSFLGGAPESPIRAIDFSDLQLTLTGDMGDDFLKHVPDPYPVWSDLPWAGIPWPFFIRHARAVSFHNCTVTWENATGHWQPDFAKCEDATIDVQHLRLLHPPASAPSETHGLVFPIGHIDGIPYYMPPVGFDYEKELRHVHEHNDANADDLAAVHGAPIPITASFIYAHPADYRGKPMLHASVPEWRCAFRRLKSMHIDTVLFQSALWRELGDCYYRSRRYRDLLHCHGVIERMLEAAAAENLHVFLGGYGSVAGWKDHLTAAELQREIDEHQACFHELCTLGHFDGMYFPAETAFEGNRRPELESRMHSLYTAFVQMVKEHDPRLRVIASPATFHHPHQNDAFLDFWDNTLKDTGLDILMPQDCIGNCIARIGEMPALWQAWKTIADHNHLTLWSHTEIFERRGYTPDCSLFPAAPARIAAQLTQVAPFVQKACCWEALHFADPEAGPEATRLMRFLQQLGAPKATSA